MSEDAEVRTNDILVAINDVSVCRDNHVRVLRKFYSDNTKRLRFARLDVEPPLPPGGLVPHVRRDGSSSGFHGFVSESYSPLAFI